MGIDQADPWGIFVATWPATWFGLGQALTMYECAPCTGLAVVPRPTASCSGTAGAECPDGRKRRQPSHQRRRMYCLKHLRSR